VLTVDFDRLQLHPGHTILDMGCGGGRHAFAALRRGANVVAFDADGGELKEVRATIGAMAEAGELVDGAPITEMGGGQVQGDALRLPFADASLDRIVCSEGDRRCRDALSPRCRAGWRSHAPPRRSTAYRCAPISPSHRRCASA
jgi:ubiquinone/menaquinone biosynthesis C-methylase UbiE